MSPESDTARPPGALQRSFALGSILLGVSVASSLLLSSGLSGQQLPELTKDDVGRPFKARSLAGFKATRDFEVADDSTTLARREQARARVQVVFDSDRGVQLKVQRGLKDAFERMQAVVAALPDVKPVEGAASKKSAPSAPKVEDPVVVALRDARRRFEEAAVSPDPEDFDVLAAARFAPELEQAAQGLIELAYHARLVSSRDELQRFDSPIVVVREIGSSTEALVGTQAPDIMDLREAGAELDRFASVPGNLLADATPLLKRAVLRLAKKQLRANLTVNTAETEARRKAAHDAVKPVVIAVKKGQRIIGDGELVTEAHLLLLNGLRAQMNQLDVLELQIGGVGLVALIVVAVWLSFSSALKRFRPSKRDALAMALWALVLLGLLSVWVSVVDVLHERFGQVPIEALQLAFPLAAGAMLVRFVMNEESSLFFTVVFSSLAGLMLGASLGTFVFCLLTSLVASDRIAKVKDRGGIFQVGVVTGLAGVLAVVFVALASGKGLGVEVAWSAGLVLASSVLLVPMLVLTLTPLVESAFGYASDLKLLELANLNHPALKELVLQAPGTYHHSIIMGSLVEAAAEAIGANPLLARSCAYYHDIGKGRNPAYFGENQKGENPHDQIAPSMSAVIIKRHVTEGLEMARQYKLPRRVADAIPQHHGTRLVGYFFNKAQRENDGKDTPTPVDEAVFRYAGPKPQFREAALVMIADAVEAASRAMIEPNSEKLRALVQKLINGIFSEGQLDECDLTLKDLRIIAESFVRTLDGIYHARPQYPAGAFSSPNLTPVTLSSANLAPVKSLVLVKDKDKKAQG